MNSLALGLMRNNHQVMTNGRLRKPKSDRSRGNNGMQKDLLISPRSDFWFSDVLCSPTPTVSPQRLLSSSPPPLAKENHPRHITSHSLNTNYVIRSSHLQARYQLSTILSKSKSSLLSSSNHYFKEEEKTTHPDHLFLGVGLHNYH